MLDVLPDGLLKTFLQRLQLAVTLSGAVNKFHTILRVFLASMSAMYKNIAIGLFMRLSLTLWDTATDRSLIDGGTA